jgi:fructose-1,6-bisphosphatase/inositol monophosphatase family enzyme
MAPLRDEAALLSRLRAIHETIRDRIVGACGRAAQEELAAPLGAQAGDVVYAVDRLSELALLAELEGLAEEWPCLVVAEGLGSNGRRALPVGTREEDAEIAILVDPIDGTRGLMYQKRSAWILTGVAPVSRDGAPPTLADVRLALQTEIPLVKQHLCDAAWAVAGEGAQAERQDRLTGARSPLVLRPSRATTIAHGFGGLAKFFAGARGPLGAIDDAVVERVLGGTGADGEALVFDDQYISTGGQLWELMTGHDRWVADVRPLLAAVMRAGGRPAPLCAHPYDLATELVAREAGVVVTAPGGKPLRAPFDVTTEVAWVGYANSELARLVGDALSAELGARGWL